MEHTHFLHITYRVWKSLKCPCEKAKDQKCNTDWRKCGFDMNGELLSASLRSWDYLWPPENGCPKSPSGLHVCPNWTFNLSPLKIYLKKMIPNLQRSETPSMHLDCKKNHWNRKQNVTSLCENTGSLEVLKIPMFWFVFFYEKKKCLLIKDSFKSADLILPSAEYRNAFSRMFSLFLSFLTWSCVGLVRWTSRWLTVFTLWSSSCNMS